MSTTICFNNELRIIKNNFITTNKTGIKNEYEINLIQFYMNVPGLTTLCF